MTTPSRIERLVQIDLALVVLVSLAGLLATLTDMPLVIRLVLDGGLVLFLPGYALLSALIVAHGLSALERVLIAIAASIAVTIAVGFALAALGLPLDRLNWVTALSGMSIGLAIVAWVRRWFRGIVSMPPRMPRMPLRQAAIALLAVLVFANAVLGSRLLGGDQLGAPPEQLWLIAEGSLAAQLGVRAGPDGGNYIVRVSSAGTTVQAYNLPLGNSEVWATTVTLSAAEARLPLVARLYQAGSDVEIRYVVLLPPVPGSDGG